MRILFTIFAFVMITNLGMGADNLPDITGSDAKAFKSHLGQFISIRGRLEQGVQGAYLLGATPKDVDFYIIADPSGGSYSWPASWMRLSHHQVCVTGELKFRSFASWRSHAQPIEQIPRDYFYLVAQQTKVRRLDTK